MENTLFNQHRMNKYSNDNSFKLSLTKHDLIKEHIEKLEKGDLKAETSNYLYFFDVFLRDILGYDRKENILFDESVDKGAKRSEFVLKNGDEKFMIVELKGQNVDLDKPQKGHHDQTPVEQAREYSLKTKSANWIMVSNYDEFRLYHWEKKDDYISFKAEELLDKDKFKYFMLAFSKKSHLKEEYADKLLKKSLVVERDLESDFYKLFHETRLMLIKELEDVNGFETPKAVHYAQAILNRYMFICFAEDINNLLPSEISTETIYVPIRERNIDERTIWNRLNELFGFINKGNKYKGVNAYNGGLFKEDFSFITIRDIVEDPNYFKEQRQKWDLKEYSLKITELMGPYGKKINPIYWNLLTISSINFESDIDVNILGHIFENSIGDLEDLREGSKGRRKKDGIFYTPNYITEYICKNTIIPYLSKSGEVTEVNDLLREYWGSEIHQLDEKVKKIKIVDPACGSGAFLNKAADILLEIHEEIHKTIYKDDKTLAQFFDNVAERRKIIKNNLYGVDLNEESVEITKLAMFLKVAQKDSKLPDIDKNIKCGNSLIDDSKYAGEKAFNWEKEFSEIFNEGGFDIVIGNPPYVRTHQLLNEEKLYFNNKFEAAFKQYDIYVLFMELGINILKNKGYLGFIVSNKFATSDYGEKIRQKILETCVIKEIVELSSLPVFKDASVYPYIISWKKEDDLKTKKEALIRISTGIDNENKFITKDYQISRIPQNRYLTNINFSFDVLNTELYEIIKYMEQNPLLGEITKITRGFRPPKEDNIIDKTEYECINSDKKSFYHKFITGKELVDAYRLKWNLKYLKYLKTEIKEYKSPEIFEQPKILMRDISIKPEAYFDEESFYCLKTIYIILEKDKNYNLKYITSLLNSQLSNFYFKTKFWASHIGGGYLRFRKQYLEQLPIYPATPEQQAPLIEKVDLMLQLNKDLQEELNSFHKWLDRTFNIEKLSKKLEKYYELDFEEFLKEVKKKKVDIKPRKTQELLENEFKESLAVIKPLLHEIKVTDREIDEMVYDLYGLTSEEREIVEESLK